MAVRAADVALCDLERHDGPGFPKDEQCDLLAFGRPLAVIELKRNDVGLPAVHTRV